MHNYHTYSLVHSEKTPEELYAHVEYDMDSEDETWLIDYNKERRRDGLSALTEDEFELIIDRLEKESFRIVSNRGDNNGQTTTRRDNDVR